jgi:hypothetical protein
MSTIGTLPPCVLLDIYERALRIQLVDEHDEIENASSKEVAVN